MHFNTITYISMYILWEYSRHWQIPHQGRYSSLQKKGRLLQEMSSLVSTILNDEPCCRWSSDNMTIFFFLGGFVSDTNYHCHIGLTTWTSTFDTPAVSLYVAADGGWLSIFCVQDLHFFPMRYLHPGFWIFFCSILYKIYDEWNFKFGQLYSGLAKRHLTRIHLPI